MPGSRRRIHCCLFLFLQCSVSWTRFPMICSYPYRVPDPESRDTAQGKCRYRFSEGMAQARWVDSTRDTRKICSGQIALPSSSLHLITNLRYACHVAVPPSRPCWRPRCDMHTQQAMAHAGSSLLSATSAHDCKMAGACPQQVLAVFSEGLQPECAFVGYVQCLGPQHPTSCWARALHSLLHAVRALRTPICTFGICCHSI